MPFAITLPDIERACGWVSYKRGEAYYQEHKVGKVGFNPAFQAYNAVVAGSRPYTVVVKSSGEDWEASCTCPVYISVKGSYCKHIAAMLLHLYHHESRLTPEENRRRVTQLVNLLAAEPTLPRLSPPASAKEQLQAEFWIQTFAYQYNTYMLGIEMKVGNKRPVYIPKIRKFLEEIRQGHPYAVSKTLSVDPARHCFCREDDEIISSLMAISCDQQIYYQAATGYSSFSSYRSNDRLLPLAPGDWERLRPLLLHAPFVRFTHRNSVQDRLEITEDYPLLDVKLSENKDGSSDLEISGIASFTPLPSYNLAVMDGKLVDLSETDRGTIEELKKLAPATADTLRLSLMPDQAEVLMERAFPLLKRLGRVKIDESIARRIVETPLKIRIYLDFRHQELEMKVEFVYGDYVVNPAHPAPSVSQGRIIVRDNGREQQLRSLLELYAWRTEGDYYLLEEEEAVYNFLTGTLPQLESMAAVYTASALNPIANRSLPAPKATLEMDDGINWLDFRFQLEGVSDEEIRLILRRLVEKKRYIRLPDGAFLSLEEEQFSQIGRFMESAGIRKGDIRSSRIRLPAVQGLALLETDGLPPSLRLGKHLRETLDNLRNPDSLDFPLPEGLQTVLRDYQKYGFQWMKTLSAYRFGGILADEMGLGKTLQAIAYIASELGEKGSTERKALIVSPASLTYNWLNEFHKFAPQIRCTVVDGSKAERQASLADVSDTDVLIASYPLLRRDIEHYAALRFHILILDEAQAIKNHATAISQNVRELQAVHRFALTGTPVENSLEELWSLYDAVFPQLFQARSSFHSLTRDQIARKIRPFLLRRLKRQVLKELPDKIETLETTQLSDEQKKLYVAYLAKIQEETLRDLQTEGFQKNRMKILSGLTRLRQLCCHPGLFVEHYQGGSGKLERLMEMVGECQANGQRILLFSQFTEMLGLIRGRLSDNGIPHFYLDGKTPSEERVKLCRRFNDGEADLFLISLRAGGTGLNLTGADTVILYDLWWNPAVEQQAADRAHRIGQKRVVQVIRLIAEGTIEEKIVELQQRKKSLVDDVIEPGEESLSALTENDIRQLLMLE